jgi:ligand-binding sensor domain-containing protein
MIKKLLFILIIITGFSIKSKAQNYNFQYLTIQKGLPQSQVYGICFDSNDYVWIGTQGGGVAIYNGDDYKYLTKEDSLISNRIYDIVQIENKIWIACKGGVSVFDLKGRYIKNYRLVGLGDIAKRIVRFSGETWIGTNSGLFFINDLDELSNYSTNPKLLNVNIQSFLFDKNAKDPIWVNTTIGIYNLKNTFNGLNTNKGLFTNYVTTSTTFKDGWLIGLYGKGVQLYDRNKGISTPKELKILNNEIVLDILVNQNEVWIATMNNGVFVWNTESNEIKNFNVNNGLSNNHVRTIVKDKWGNIWIGTSGGGISIYNNSPFLEYNKSNGLNSNYIYAVLKDINNNLWVSTEGTGVVRLNDTSTVLFDEEYGYKSVKTRVIFEDNDHNIWFGSEGEGLGVWLPKDGKDTVYSFDNPRDLHSNWIKSFAQNPRTGQMFFSTFEGIYYITNYNNFPLEIKFNKIENKKIPSRISQICFDKNGILYFASNQGVGEVVLNIKNSKKWATTILSSSDVNFRNVVIHDSIFYAGSSDRGILRLNLNDAGNQTWITTDNWLNSNNIYQLTFHRNELWVGTEKGLTKLRITEFHQIKANKFYQYEDGFEGLETNTNAAYNDHQNKLWFGTTNGLFSFNGAVSNQEQKRPPNFRLTDVQLFYESILNTEYARFLNHPDKDSILVLPYDKNHIGFNLEAIHYSYSKQIRYRWKLEGADKDWIPPTKNTTATYGNLAPGKYVFLAQVSIDDSWDSEPIEFKFEVETPFWDALWFKLSYILVSIFITGMIILIIYKRFKRKNKKLRDKLDVERSILDLEQKALRLQMNPHFIFNALNSIHNLIILNDSANARYALSKFSKLMRMVLENSREKVISIDDEVETLENYVQLEKLTTQNEFEFSIEIDEEIDPNEPILPPLMIQPFIENAIIHGFKNIMHIGVIKVSFRLLGGNILHCTIDDNGIGRANASKINAQKENYHKSTALQVTQERLSNINSKPSFSPFQIIDKIDKEGYCLGTTIIIQLEI